MHDALVHAPTSVISLDTSPENSRPRQNPQDVPKLPESCNLSVVEAVLDMMAQVVRVGNGEKTLSKKKLVVVGNAARLMDGSLGGCGRRHFYEFMKVTVFDFLMDKDVQSQVLPCFR